MAGGEKQAVLLIHGIGEQRPMQTLWSFVDAVWTKNKGIHHDYSKAEGQVWSKPDEASESFELRRLTTGKNIKGVRTDFFEFYWAHLMRGTNLSHVTSWARMLLLRNPSSVPTELFPIWLILLLVSLAAFALILWGAFVSDQPNFMSILFGLILLPAIESVLRNVVGDAARYLNPSPPNIECRQKIRSAGVELLQILHKRGYRRIVVVGHSLGSVIGFDILTHAWVKHHKMVSPNTTSRDKALLDLEAVSKKSLIANGKLCPGGIDGADLNEAADFADLQHMYFHELQRNGNGWLVTDFVTLGSPLAHAPVLLAEDDVAFRKKQRRREFPTCPPLLEGGEGFSFELKCEESKNGKLEITCCRVPHHAAVFGPTRWTNLYFPSSAIIFGDIIAGPLRNVFGPGVKDVPVETNLRRGLLCHTLYWKLPKNQLKAPHIDALRQAVRLDES